MKSRHALVRPLKIYPSDPTFVEEQNTKRERMGAMAQAMNPAIERALHHAAHAVDGSEALIFLGRPSDAKIARILKDTQVRPLAAGLKHQLTQALARMRGLIEPEDRSLQMRLIADLQTRLGFELNEMKKFG
ncbi:MAG: hypothetical protein GY883_11915 [Shimia sp.]|nr:hypothetical protein [Shimia sp.]